MFLGNYLPTYLPATSDRALVLKLERKRRRLLNFGILFQTQPLRRAAVLVARSSLVEGVDGIGSANCQTKMFTFCPL